MPVPASPVETAENEGKLATAAVLPTPHPAPPENRLTRYSSKDGSEKISVPKGSLNCTRLAMLYGASVVAATVVVPLTPPLPTK